MRQFKSSSIRNNIILLIIIMTLVPFGFMACSLVLERKHQQNEAMRESSIYAGQIAKLVSQIAENTELLLNMLSRLPMVQTGDEKAVNSFLFDLVNQYPQYSSIFIVDKAGKRWATTNQMSGSVSYSERRYFANAVSSGQFSSGEYAVGKVKKRPVFSFGLPVINSSGAISGVAVATIELSGLRDLLLKHISKDHMSLVVMDHKGKILIHSTRPDLEGTQERNAVFGRMLQGSREAVIESEEEQGTSAKLLAYKKLFLSAETEPYIYVALHTEKSFLLKESNRKFGLNLIVLMTAALSSFVIVYRTSKPFLLDKVDESEHRHRILFETSPQGIIYQNADGAVISSNPSSEKLFGKLLVDMDAGKTLAENPLYIHEDGAPYPLETHPSMEALSTGKAVSGSIMGIFNSSDGTYTWLRINSIPISRADEKMPYMVYSMYEDITRQMKQEQERLEIERQLLHTQKLESLGIMAGGIAHDFNNLLQSILGNIELASMKLAPDSSAKNLLSNAMISGKQAAQLTNLMLAYVGKGLIDKKKLDLNLLIRENARIFRSAATTSVSIELSLSAELPAIIADEAQIQQVIMNLITNASEAIDKLPGIVRLATGVQNCDQKYIAASLLKEKPEPGRYVFLEVSDNGCGMNEEILKRLFDPFFTTKFTGRGLGMSAAMGIIKAHSGALFVESIPGKGTTFRVLFPVSDSALAATVQRPPGTPPKIEATPANPLSGLVLVVDDEKTVLKTCSKMVELFGFTVITASDGIDAVSKFREHADEIAVVLMDLTMPSMDGITAMNHIYNIRTDTRIILASGFNEEELSERISGQPPSGFIRKPYNMSELEEEMRRVIRGAQAN